MNSNGAADQAKDCAHDEHLRAMNLDAQRIAVIGLGYVGLPLAVEFGKVRPVTGFDIRPERIAELCRKEDRTREVPRKAFDCARHVSFTNDADLLKDCGIFIVTVPTPLDKANRPDLTLLLRATETVARVMPEGAVVIYESTVYPGCTRQVCVPVLEKLSGRELNKGFYVGYSPERMNPGDPEHRLPMIEKVTSGSTPECAEAVDRLYAGIITAGTHKVSSIEVAEAAKIIENTQRDLNIALMNELAVIYTHEVLGAAETKWNFLPFRPGLVGGHCIGVDPYYLTYRAQEAGYHPEVILAGRRINDGMGQFVADRVARLMMKAGFPVVGSRILVMGMSFKENCADLRNSRVIDMINGLRDFCAEVDIWDPWIDPEQCRIEYEIDCLRRPPARETYDAVVVAVAHREFVEMGPACVRALSKAGGILYDVKGIFPRAAVDGRL